MFLLKLDVVIVFFLYAFLMMFLFINSDIWECDGEFEKGCQRKGELLSVMESLRKRAAFLLKLHVLDVFFLVCIFDDVVLSQFKL